MLHLLCINLQMVLFSKYALVFCIWKVSYCQCVKEEVKFSHLEVNTGMFYVSICKLWKKDRQTCVQGTKKEGKKRDGVRKKSRGWH